MRVRTEEFVGICLPSSAALPDSKAKCCSVDPTLRRGGLVLVQAIYTLRLFNLRDP